MGFPRGEGPPSLGLSKQPHGREAAPAGRRPGLFLPPPGGAPGLTRAHAIICPVGEPMSTRHTSGEIADGPGCSRHSRIPGHHGTPTGRKTSVCSFATAAVTHRHKLGGLKQHAFILLKFRRWQSVSVAKTQVWAEPVLSGGSGGHLHSWAHGPFLPFKARRSNLRLHPHLASSLLGSDCSLPPAYENMCDSP